MFVLHSGVNLGVVEERCFLLHERSKHLRKRRGDDRVSAKQENGKLKSAGNLCAQSCGHTRASDAEEHGLKGEEESITNEEADRR
jgi:hypothetical protein